MKVYIDKIELAEYIAYKYKEETGKDISCERLNQYMYMVYSLWAGNALRINKLQHTHHIIHLFKPNFLTDDKGPIDPDIEKDFDRIKLSTRDHIIVRTNLKANQRTLSNFVDKATKPLNQHTNTYMRNYTKFTDAFQSSHTKGQRCEIRPSLIQECSLKRLEEFVKYQEENEWRF